MTRLSFSTALLALSVLACGRPDLPPPPPGPDSGLEGFPISARQPCSNEVGIALRSTDPLAIRRAAARGAKFTCTSDDRDVMGYALPLDRAVVDDRPDRVRALLAAGADPNARWWGRGDRHPLQEAVECSYWSTGWLPRCRNGAEMVRLLLRAGADPNAGWCQFESRPDHCTTAHPVRPLMAAAESNQADVVALLLAAGADPRLQDSWGDSALAHAFTGPVFQLIATAMFPDPKTRDAQALRHMTEQGRSTWFDGPWNATALGQAIVTRSPHLLPPPPPPPPPRPGTRPPPSPPVEARPSSVYVNLMLDIGADANERVSAAGQWPPLALAANPSAAAALLDRGADPDLRWCVPFPHDGQQWKAVVPPGCTLATGTTPLMQAAALESDELVSLLVEAGARVDLRDWQGRTALDYAPAAARARLAKLLTPQPAAVAPSR
jgi:ankyrin repeat protein